MVRRIAIAFLAVGSVGLSMAGAQPPKDRDIEEILKRPLDDRRDLTLLKRLTDDTFLHEQARVSFTIPKGWKEIPPHRLHRVIDPRISTVLGSEQDGRDLVASLYWQPLNPTQKLSDYVRSVETKGEFGEEYEVLKAIYGKNRVSIPTRVKQGPLEVYKISISGGADAAGRYDGTLYLFEVENGETRWLVKARVSYPKADKGSNEQYAEQILQGYARYEPKTEAKKEPAKKETEGR